MTPVEKHAASQANSDLASTTLMGWVSRAKILLDGGKLDGLAIARIGELLLNACRYLSMLAVPKTQPAMPRSTGPQQPPNKKLPTGF